MTADHVWAGRCLNWCMLRTVLVAHMVCRSSSSTAGPATTACSGHSSHIIGSIVVSSPWTCVDTQARRPAPVLRICHKTRTPAGSRGDNQVGLLGGRKIVLDVEHSAVDKQQAVNAARKLIGRDEVVAIIGSMLVSTRWWRWQSTAPGNPPQKKRSGTLWSGSTSTVSWGRSSPVTTVARSRPRASQFWSCAVASFTCWRKRRLLFVNAQIAQPRQPGVRRAVAGKPPAR